MSKATNETSPLVQLLLSAESSHDSSFKIHSRNAAADRYIAVVDALLAGRNVQQRRTSDSAWYTMKPNQCIDLSVENDFRIKGTPQLTPAAVARLQMIKDLCEQAKQGAELQFNTLDTDGFKDMHSAFNFLDGNVYRVKPSTRNINGFEVPAPEKELPDINEDFYVPSVTTSKWYSGSYLVSGDCDELRWLERGMIFLTKEAAIANAKAMAGIDPNS